MSIKRRPNFEIVLNNLRAGEDGELSVTLGGEIYYWAGGRLCHKVKVWHGNDINQEPDEIHFNEAYLYFKDFVAMCEELSDDEVTAMVMQTTLFKHHRNKR